MTVYKIPEKWQIAWIAGIVEGEGCIHIPLTPKPGWVRPTLGVSMTDFDVLQRLQSWTGVGSLAEVKKRRHQTKRIWYWHVGKQKDVLWLVRLLLPYFCSRRRAKAESVIQLLEETQRNSGLGRGRQHRIKTCCSKGHKYTSQNTYVSSQGARQCRECKRQAFNRWKAKDPEHARVTIRHAQRRYRERQRQITKAA